MRITQVIIKNSKGKYIDIRTANSIISISDAKSKLEIFLLVFLIYIYTSITNTIITNNIKGNNFISINDNNINIDRIIKQS